MINDKHVAVLIEKTWTPLDRKTKTCHGKCQFQRCDLSTSELPSEKHKGSLSFVYQPGAASATPTPPTRPLPTTPAVTTEESTTLQTTEVSTKKSPRVFTTDDSTWSASYSFPETYYYTTNKRHVTESYHIEDITTDAETTEDWSWLYYAYTTTRPSTTTVTTQPTMTTTTTTPTTQPTTTITTTTPTTTITTTPTTTTTTKEDRGSAYNPGTSPVASLYPPTSKPGWTQVRAANKLSLGCAKLHDRSVIILSCQMYFFRFLFTLLFSSHRV